MYFLGVFVYCCILLFIFALCLHICISGPLFRCLHTKFQRSTAKYKGGAGGFRFHYRKQSWEPSSGPFFVVIVRMSRTVARSPRTVRICIKGGFALRDRVVVISLLALIRIPVIQVVIF